MIELSSEWQAVLQSINATMVSTRALIRSQLDVAYDAAYECEPGCTCDNIWIEMDEVIRVQNDITVVMEQLRVTLASLTENQTKISDVCETYITIDDAIFYDL